MMGWYRTSQWPSGRASALWLGGCQVNPRPHKSKDYKNGMRCLPVWHSASMAGLGGVRSPKDSWVWHHCCSLGNRSNAENKLHRLKMSYLILVASVNKIIEEPWMLDLHPWGRQKHANTVLPHDHWQSSILEDTSSFPPLYKIWPKCPRYPDVIMSYAVKDSMEAH